MSKKELFDWEIKIIQTENNYRINAYNGDIGYIVAVNREATKAPQDWCLEIAINHQTVKYNYHMLNQINLGYVCSVHKVQGGEYEQVIYLWDKSGAWIMNKKLLYTVITRAKSHLTLIGPLAIFWYKSVTLNAQPHTWLQLWSEKKEK